MAVSIKIAIAIAIAAAGCRVGTQYVPQTPGRATFGIEGGDLGIYKDGVFTKLRAGPPNSLGCSPQAATAALGARRSAAAAGRNELISVVSAGVGAVFPPMFITWAIFLGLAEDEREQSVALAVDAVNLNNDAPACAHGAEGSR